ncbi:MAG: peptide chain release factor N(5)-glutamine methyltransferase [Kiloniellales bacterium]
MSATPLGRLLDEAAAQLAKAGLESPRREARALFTQVLPGSSAALYDRDRPIDAALARRLQAAVARRAEREPLARIVGSREFWSLDFALSPDTLEPRPDSETLVAAAHSVLTERDGPYRILDLGTGSGCLLLAILSERPAAWGLGLDRSLGALRQAAENATALGLSSRAQFLLSDWGAALCGSFDLIVSNPPYIERATLPNLQPEVARYDPRLALDGGADGLAAYRRLVPQAAALLAPGAWLVLEFGQGQETAIRRMVLDTGLEDCGLHADLSGMPRVLCARQSQ